MNDQRSFVSSAARSWRGPLLADLLKKSVDEIIPIFPASLVRFLERDARDLIAQRVSDVDRCKLNCEAIYNRFQISIRFELVCALL